MSNQPTAPATPAPAPTPEPKAKAKAKVIVNLVALTGKGGIIPAGTEITADMFKGDGAKVIADRLKSGHLVEQ